MKNYINVNKILALNQTLKYLFLSLCYNLDKFFTSFTYLQHFELSFYDVFELNF